MANEVARRVSAGAPGPTARDGRPRPSARATARRGPAARARPGFDPTSSSRWTKRSLTSSVAPRLAGTAIPVTTAGRAPTVPYQPGTAGTARLDAMPFMARHPGIDRDVGIRVFLTEEFMSINGDPSRRRAASPRCHSARCHTEPLLLRRMKWVRRRHRPTPPSGTQPLQNLIFDRCGKKPARLVAEMIRIAPIHQGDRLGRRDRAGRRGRESSRSG